MRKKKRQELILQLVETSRISTQNQLREALKQKGFGVTQTTLSRDLHELSLMKAKDEDGIRYVLPDYQEKDSYLRQLANYVQKVERASFVLVLHTKLGEAGVGSNVLDGAKPHAILGTIAGADTIIVICRDEAAAISVETELNHRIVR